MLYSQAFLLSMRAMVGARPPEEHCAGPHPALGKRHDYIAAAVQSLDTSYLPGHRCAVRDPEDEKFSEALAICTE